MRLGALLPAAWAGLGYALVGRCVVALGGPAQPWAMGLFAATVVGLVVLTAGPVPRWATATAWAVSVGAFGLLHALPLSVFIKVLAAIAGPGYPAEAAGLIQALLAWGATMVAWLAVLGWRIAGELVAGVQPARSVSDGVPSPASSPVPQPTAPPRSRSGLVGSGRLLLAFLVLYGGLTVWTAQIQSLTGDEPHFLLLARSLDRDGDTDLTADYATGRYREFFPSDLLRRTLRVATPLDPHDVPGVHGERRPVHQLGFALLLIPGDLLAGRAGAQAVAVLLAALTALAAVGVCRSVTTPPDPSAPASPERERRGAVNPGDGGGGTGNGHDAETAPRRSRSGLAGVVSGPSPAFGNGTPSLTLRAGRSGGGAGREAAYGAIAVTLLSPLVAYCGSLHSDVAGALCLAVLALLAVTPRPSTGLIFAATAAALALPWLHLKLLPAALLLVLLTGLDARRRGEAAGWLPAVALGLGLVTQLAAFAVMYGSWSPSAPQLRGGGKFPGPLSGSLFEGLPGLLFDQQDGLVWAWPLVLLALPGALLLARAGAARRLLAVIALHGLLIATYRIWGSGFAPAGRQLLPIVPLLGPFLGTAAARLRERWPVGLGLLVAYNAAGVLLTAWLPRLRYPLVLADGSSRAALLGRLPLPGRDVLWPALASGGLARAAGWVYLGVWLVASAVWVRRATERNPG